MWLLDAVRQTASSNHTSNNLPRIRRHRTKFNRQHDEAPGTCTPLVKSVIVLCKLIVSLLPPSPYTELCEE